MAAPVNPPRHALRTLRVQIADLLAYESAAEEVREDDTAAVLALARRQFAILPQPLSGHAWALSRSNRSASSTISCRRASFARHASGMPSLP